MNMNEPSKEALEPAPWCRDAWFVLTTAGDGQGTSLHRGWVEICDAVVAAHYFEPDAEQRREVMDRFTDFDDWQHINGVPWQWSVSYEDGFVTVERVTDTLALDRFRAEEREWQPIETAPKDRPILGAGTHGRPEVYIWRNGSFIPPRAAERLREIGSASFQSPTHWMPLPEPSFRSGKQP